ncbi:MAG: hypothetical protein HRU12_19750 [Phaeodactylibacter sp.]|nr:hypothetical protein [Phaeodactylibacter sp.]
MITSRDIVLALGVGVCLGMAYEANAEEKHHEIQVGFYTKHLTGDTSELNETNNIISYTYHQLTDPYDWHLTYSFGDFSNSHDVASNYIGLGYSKTAFNGAGSYGVAVLAVSGYEGYVDTMYKGLVFMPVPTVRYGYAAVSLFGPVAIGTVSINF